MAARVLSLSILPHNDIHLSATGNLAMAVDETAIGQHIRQRLMFWKGEWFLDLGAGVDWGSSVFTLQPGQMELADALIKREIVRTPGVVEILEYRSRYDRASRGLIVERVRVLTSTGAAVAVSVQP